MKRVTVKQRLREVVIWGTLIPKVSRSPCIKKNLSHAAVAVLANLIVRGTLWHCIICTAG